MSHFPSSSLLLPGTLKNPQTWVVKEAMDGQQMLPALRLEPLGENALRKQVLRTEWLQDLPATQPSWASMGIPVSVTLSHCDQTTSPEQLKGGRLGLGSLLERSADHDRKACA